MQVCIAANLKIAVSSTLGKKKKFKLNKSKVLGENQRNKVNGYFQRKGNFAAENLCLANSGNYF